MDYKLVLDVMVAALLAVTIIYAWILNQRLNQLRRNRDDLAKVVSSFNDATARAEAGIPKLRKAAEEVRHGVAGKGREGAIAARRPRLHDRARRRHGRPARTGRAASRARKCAAPAHPTTAPVRPTPQRATMTPPVPPAAPAGPGFGVEAEDERSEAERELLRALQSVR